MWHHLRLGILFIILFFVCSSVNAFDGPGLYKDGEKVMGFDLAPVEQTVIPTISTQEMPEKIDKKRKIQPEIVAEAQSFAVQKKYVAAALACKNLANEIREKLDQGQNIDEELTLLIQKGEEFAEANLDIIKKFNDVEKKYEDKGTSNVILDRHERMVREHKKGTQNLLLYLKKMSVLNNKEEILENIDNVISFFSQGKFKNDPPLLNSQALPVNILKIDAPVIRKESLPDIYEVQPGFEPTGPAVINPLTLTVKTEQAPDEQKSTVSAASEGISVFSASPPTQDDLDPTIDIQFTQEIIDLANSLDNSSLKIYEYVKNNFEFEPYLGSRKGSGETLNHKSGSDYDLASLLIALLRVSGIPARYATGIVEMPVDTAKNWLGVDDAATAGSILTTAGMEGVNIISDSEVVSIRCRRVWVEAYIPYTNYRGIGTDGSGKMWVPMDPAMRQYDYQAGLDIPAEMGFDAKAFVNDYISTFHADSPVTMYKQQIMDYLTLTYPDLSYEDIVRSRSLHPENLGIIPGSLPYRLLTRDGEFAKIASDKRYRIRFYIHDAGATLDYTANLPEIAGKQVTISYVGETAADQQIIDDAGGVYGVTEPWLVSLKPILKINGCIVATGSGGVTMGMRQSSDMFFTQPTGAHNQIPAIYNEIVAGTYQGIGINTWNVVTNPFSFMPATACEESYTGFLLHDTAIKYLSRVNAADEEVGRTMQIIVTNDVAEAIVEHVVNVSYNGFGTPISFEWSGLNVDADRKIVGAFSVTGDDEGLAFMRLTGADGSLSENLIFEDEFNEPAVSTIKILELASDMRIPIYEFDIGNAGSIYSSLNLSATVENAIYSAVVSNGHVVTVPRDNITYYDWTGTGYIDMDPTTGAAGYIISGGTSGGQTVKKWDIDMSGIYCINATINSITPAVTNDIYCAGDTRYLVFNTTIQPYDKDCNAGTSYTKNFSTAGGSGSPMTIKDIADAYGAGVYTFYAGSSGGCTGSCGSDSKEFTIFKIKSITPECSSIGTSQIIGLTAIYEPSILNRTTTWSIIGDALGASVGATGGTNANLQTGNNRGIITVKACDSISTTTCATVDLIIEGCKECQGGGTVNTPNGTLSTTECCFDGGVVAKTGLTIDDLLAKCPDRTQNATYHDIDGCSGGVSQDPAASIYAQDSTVFGVPQGIIANAAAAFNLPCNQHDICYQTCRSAQDSCDRGMHSDMDTVCTAAFPSGCPYSGREIVKCPDYFIARGSCFSSSDIYYRGLRLFGGKAWKERQTQYCDCCP